MIRLLSDFVAIRPDPPAEKRHGKIIIPQTVDTSADSGWIEEGVIVAAGPGDRDTPDGSLRPVTVKVGDRVLYVGGRSGTWVDVDGESLLVVHEEQFILAVIEPAAERVPEIECGGMSPSDPLFKKAHVEPALAVLSNIYGRQITEDEIEILDFPIGIRVKPITERAA